jgi:hypothetical protein
MHTLIALFALAGLTGTLMAEPATNPAPPDNDPAPAAAINQETLRGLAEQSLANAGLSEDGFVGDLWNALVDRTGQAIAMRHQVRAIESSMRKLAAELDALRAFVSDHEQFGDDFASYQAVIAETRKLTEAQIALKRQQEQMERQRQREEARKKQEEAKAKRQRAKSTSKRLEQLGFTSVGDDVYLSKSAYAYAMRNVPEQRVFYQPSPTGEVQQLTTVENREEIDHSRMTISGSLLNAAMITRNIGVAFVFRDAHGNQIGQETVVIENARPEVPYPFTGELIMASDKPFASMTSWVLFADAAPPATTTQPNTPPANTPPASTPPASTPPANTPPTTP